MMRIFTWSGKKLEEGRSNDDNGEGAPHTHTCTCISDVLLITVIKETTPGNIVPLVPGIESGVIVRGGKLVFRCVCLSLNRRC